MPEFTYSPIVAGISGGLCKADANSTRAFRTGAGTRKSKLTNRLHRSGLAFGFSMSCPSFNVLGFQRSFALVRQPGELSR